MIDAVITWVNGNDPEHQAKRSHALAEVFEGKEVHFEQGATSSTRFSDCGELYYNIHLLRINSPWIAKIYLITDNQRPEWLNREEEKKLGVQLVSHEEIFDGFTHFLPTFNSLSIETVMHRISGLSDRFIYLNDDSFVVSPTREEDYFSRSQPIFRGWVRTRRYRSRLEKLLFENLISPKHIYPDESHHSGLVGLRMGREKILRGRKHIVNLFHTPHPIVRTSYAAAMESRLDSNAKFKFRSEEQFAPVPLYANLLFQKRQCKVISPDVAYFSPDIEQSLSRERISASVNASGVKHACFQSLDEYDDVSRRAALSFLEEISSPTIT